MEGWGHGEPQAEQAVPRRPARAPSGQHPPDGFRDSTGKALATSAEKPSRQAVTGGWREDLNDLGGLETWRTRRG